MALSYEFSIGSVRAKENALFSKTDLEQLLGCKTTAELCQTLSDKGYGTVGAFDEMTKRHMDGVWEYLRRIAPDFGVFAPCPRATTTPRCCSHPARWSTS